MPKTKPTSSHFINKSTVKSELCLIEADKASVISIVCRICYDGDKDEPIITPCVCRGTVAFVHRSCLEIWLAESNATACELCNYVYKTERTPKYTAKESIWRWFRNPPINVGFHMRGLKCDIVTCGILTPLAIIITYVCLFSADYYNQQKFSNVPAAKWTSVSLLVMVSVMLMGYYLWVYMVIRYHGTVWYYCWQRDCVVTYIAPNTDNTCYARDMQTLPSQISTIHQDNVGIRINDENHLHVQNQNRHENIGIATVNEIEIHSTNEETSM